MKKFKSKTNNRGTTIILEDCTEAIETVDLWISNGGMKNLFQHYNPESFKRSKGYWEKCKSDLVTGNPTFRDSVEKIIDDLLEMVDGIQPLFSQQKQGYTRTDGESAINASAELLMQGEEMCGFKRKLSEEKKVKQGSGDGAYRILINTDVSWWGSPEMNCGLVAAMIILLQRYAPVEIWIQQGWLGSSKEDGVTLFKLDYSAAININNLAFWICHPNKDNVFSYLVNKALKRNNTATSCVAEIECDLMLRGDWFAKEGISYDTIYNATPFEKMQIVADWIAKTGYKIVYEDNNEPPEITE